MALEAKYFVLKPRAKSRDDLWAQASQHAMVEYAIRIKKIDPTLYEDLLSWIHREQRRQAEMEATNQ